MVCGQLTTEELGLAGDAEGGTFLGILKANIKLAHGPSAGRLGGSQAWPLWLDMRGYRAGTGRALKANSSRPTVRPGRGSYLVPAFATMARRVVGPLSSRAATLTPAMVVGSYDALGEAAAAAKPRAPWRRMASWLPLDRAALQIMVWGVAVCRQLTIWR